MTGALILLTFGVIIFVVGYNGTGEKLFKSLSSKQPVKQTMAPASPLPPDTIRKVPGQ